MKKAAITVVVFLAVIAIPVGLHFRKRADIVVGSKHFTEQKILGEMIAQLIEAKTKLKVRRRLGLQGTKVCFGAIQEGDLDIYPDYTGTGLVNILEEDYAPSQSRQDVFSHVRDEFAERWNIVWLRPLGFANTYAFAMREDHAEKLGVTNVSDLEKHRDTIRPGFDHEYTTRPEFKRFGEVYGFTFGKKITKLDPDLTYKALKEEAVDLIDAFSTDGRIAAYKLRVLADDKHLFPPYDCSILIRQATLDRHPELRGVLGLLSGAISPEEMQKMNYAVTEEVRSPAAVAAEFLRKKKLLP